MLQFPVSRYIRRGAVPLLLSVSISSAPAGAAVVHPQVGPLGQARDGDGPHHAHAPATNASHGASFLDTSSSHRVAAKAQVRSEGSASARRPMPMLLQAGQPAAGLGAPQGRYISMNWLALCALAVVIPILIVAGFASFSNSRDWPGVVANCIAIVTNQATNAEKQPAGGPAGARAGYYGSTAGARPGTAREAGGPTLHGDWRRPVPHGFWQQGAAESRRPTSSAKPGSPLHVAGSASGPLHQPAQHRRWTDPRFEITAPSPKMCLVMGAQEAKPRVHFMEGPMPGADAKPEGFPFSSAATQLHTGTPQAVPIFCEPKPAAASAATTDQENASSLNRRGDY
eukprot:CAMPEP_0195061696 /NCGR_PEP_ID=MMETSP0448-20130528/8505_1 /TAXON_ID=66468 /ORGANISM="Heterocapsa triquestra, Strain CCMP 448" /LENGTH=340 /DNA_ID=CAMNT_0040092287 /DNA_START=56 /DNA_END=1078 /DNA_ORIENTATION=-